MASIILSIILFAVAVLCFVFSYFQFKEKGFLFNNSYIYAAEKERKKMNKKPYYRQSAITFIFIGIIFLINGFDAIFKTKFLFIAVIAVVIITLIFAIASTVLIEKKNK